MTDHTEKVRTVLKGGIAPGEVPEATGLSSGEAKVAIRTLVRAGEVREVDGVLVATAAFTEPPKGKSKAPTKKSSKKKEKEE